MLEKIFESKFVDHDPVTMSSLEQVKEHMKILRKTYNEGSIKALVYRDSNGTMFSMPISSSEVLEGCLGFILDGAKEKRLPSEYTILGGSRSSVKKIK